MDQAVEHRTSIVEVMGSNPIGASEFFLGFICNCLSYFTTAKISFTNLHLYLLQHSYQTCLCVFPLSSIAANIYPLSSSSMCTVSLDRSSTSSNFVIPSGIHLLHKKETKHLDIDCSIYGDLSTSWHFEDN